MNNMGLGLIDLNPVGFNFYPFLISLDRFNGTCSTDEDLLVEICVLNKTKAINSEVFIIATRINESKALLKHISCNCKCKFDNTECNWNQKLNGNKGQCECRSIIITKKITFSILAPVFVVPI